MDIGRAHIVIRSAVLVCIMIVVRTMLVTVIMIVFMTMRMSATEDEGADDVHDEADGCDEEGVAIVDGYGREEPLARLDRDAEPRNAQHDGAREGRQIAELA